VIRKNAWRDNLNGPSPLAKQRERVRKRSGPVRAIESAVLDGFAEVFGLNGVGSVEVGYGAGDFEDAIVGARGKAEAGDGVFEKFLALCRNGAVLANETRRHLRVSVSFLFGRETSGLAITRGDDAGTDGGGIFAGRRSAEFLVFDGGNFDVDVDAVEKRAGNFCDVALDDGRSAVTLAGGVAEVAARTGIHGGGKHEARRKRDGRGGARDGDGTVFERLAHDFEYVALKFGELIEEENAVMTERNFARARNGAAANEARIADGVMRRAKRARADEAAGIFERARNGMNARGFDGFFERHRGKNRGNALGEHSFASAGRADEENVVPAGTSDFQGAFRGLLAVNLAEVDTVFGGFAEEKLRVDLRGSKGFRGIDEIDGLGKSFYGINFDAVDDGRFASVGLGDSERDETGIARRKRSRERAADGTDAAIERQFTEKHHLVDRLAKELAHATSEAESHWKIKRGAFFLDVGGSEIDGNALAVREFDAAIAEGGFDAFAAFFYGIIGKADDVEIVHAGRANVDFDFDKIGIDAKHSGTEGFEEHERGKRPFRGGRTHRTA